MNSYKGIEVNIGKKTKTPMMNNLESSQITGTQKFDRWNRLYLQDWSITAKASAEERSLPLINAALDRIMESVEESLQEWPKDKAQ